MRLLEDRPEGAEKEAEGVGVPGMHVPQADG